MGRKRASSSEKPPEEIRDFLADLGESLRRRLPDVSVYLTGSYARGDWIDDSDVDIVVVSEAFRGMDIGKRYRLVKELSKPGFSLEVLAYTPGEFSSARRRSVILNDMMQYARRIK